MLNIAVMDVLRTNFKQPCHCSHEFSRRYAKCLAYASDSRRRNISTSLEVIQLSVANNDLIRRQIVVNIREVNRKHLVPQERQRLKRVERVDSKYARQLSVFANCFQ